MQDVSRKALVLFSGGQDSTSCLAWALANFRTVETVGFFYGQRHAVEMDARPSILAKLRAGYPEWSQRLGQDFVLPLDVLREIGGSALTEDSEISLSTGGYPTTFVPGRNVLFLTCAAALAYRRGITDLVGGMCETDYSGYPDCRDATIRSTGETLSLAMDKVFTIHTPLMWLDKAATWKLAEDLGGAALIDMIVDDTVTCYRGDREHKHDWGYGCADCPACALRAQGWEKYRATWNRSPTAAAQLRSG